MKTKIIEEFIERSDQKEKGKIPFTNLDGRITEYSRELRETLNKKNLNLGERQKKPYHENTFYHLSNFESQLDTYKELLNKQIEKNNEILLPNVNYHVNTLGKLYFEECFLNQNTDYAPYFSKKNFNLTKELDSNSYESVQILKQEKPGLFKEKKDIQTNYDFAHQMTSLMYSNPEFREELIKIQESYEGPRGLVEKYFDKLNFEKQRNERFRVGTELLYSLFEESINQSKS